jgi:hypothetical protein
MKANCAYCGRQFEIATGWYNRSTAMGMKVYCSRKHSGLARRIDKTIEEKKEEKWWYDAFNRLALADLIKVRKAEYFKRDYAAHPEKYRRERRRLQPRHNEYCRRPEYRRYKKGYDRVYRANKFYGPMADAFLALMDLRQEIDNRFAKQQNNLINKSQKRKRSCQKQIPKNSLNSLLVP